MGGTALTNGDLLLVGGCGALLLFTDAPVGLVAGGAAFFGSAALMGGATQLLDAAERKPPAEAEPLERHAARLGLLAFLLFFGIAAAFPWLVGISDVRAYIVSALGGGFVALPLGGMALRALGRWGLEIDRDGLRHKQLWRVVEVPWSAVDALVLLRMGIGFHFGVRLTWEGIDQVRCLRHGRLAPGATDALREQLREQWGGTADLSVPDLAIAGGPRAGVRAASAWTEAPVLYAKKAHR